MYEDVFWLTSTLDKLSMSHAPVYVIRHISAQAYVPPFFRFLPSRSYDSAVISRRRVSVCLCLSVTRRYCIKTAKCRITQTTPRDSRGQVT